ncbi:hypothetical protein EVAR_96206_1, partial [Eumeta japonica]
MKHEGTRSMSTGTEPQAQSR